MVKTRSKPLYDLHSRSGPPRRGQKGESGGQTSNPPVRLAGSVKRGQNGSKMTLFGCFGPCGQKGVQIRAPGGCFGPLMAKMTPFWTFRPIRVTHSYWTYGTTWPLRGSLSPLEPTLARAIWAVRECVLSPSHFFTTDHYFAILTLLAWLLGNICAPQKGVKNDPLFDHFWPKRVQNTHFSGSA